MAWAFSEKYCKTKSKSNSHKIGGIHSRPAVTEKFDAGGTARHDCGEKEQSAAIISSHLPREKQAQTLLMLKIVPSKLYANRL